jgi:thiamine-phosphate pyrophosphorylase
MRLPDPPLLLITDRAQAHKPLADVVTAVLAGGCRWVSLREKDLPAADQVALAKQLLPITRQFGAYLTLHGDPKIAHACGMDGVHIPADRDAARVRAELGAQMLVGCSIHTVSEALALDPAIVDYAIAGPAYTTASKPGYGPALGPSGVQAIAGATPVPIVAIGGIETPVVADVLAGGAVGIAVMGGVMRATDQAAYIAALLRALADAKRQPRGR